MNTSDLIAKIRNSVQESLDPAARERILARVLQEFRQVTQATSEGRTRYVPMQHAFRQQPSLLFKTVAAALVLALGIGTTVAAEGARPGDPLYRWERGVEQVRLGMTVGGEARAKFEATIAEEREQELQELKNEKSKSAPAAEQETTKALEEAIETVTEVQQKQEQKGNERAAETLHKVQERLKELQKRHRESSSRLNEDERSSGLTEAIAKVMGKIAEVKIEFNGKESVFVIQSTSEADIVAAISQRTGLSAAEIRRILIVAPVPEPTDESETQDSDDDQQININTRTNVNTRVNVNVSTDDDSSAEASVKIDVKTNENRTEIETRVNGVERKWTLASTNRALILASVVTKTGLSAGTVGSIWQYTVEDGE